MHLPRELTAFERVGFERGAVIGLLAPSAQAVTGGPFIDTVSCAATITDTLKTFSQPTQGGLTFNKVSDEDGGFAEVVWALSSNGNSVGKKTVSPGNPVSWSGVLPSKTARPATGMAVI